MDGSKNLTELAGDLQEDINKTPLIEVAIDVTEERKTDSPRASKRRVKRHDLPSSVDTSCSGHNMVTSKKSRGSGRTSHDGTRLRDDDGEAECMRHISTETVHSPPMNKNEDNVEITSDKPKKRTEKRQTALKDPPQSPVEQQFDEKTREMAVLNSVSKISPKTSLLHKSVTLHRSVKEKNCWLQLIRNMRLPICIGSLESPWNA